MRATDGWACYLFVIERLGLRKTGKKSKEIRGLKVSKSLAHPVDSSGMTNDHWTRSEQMGRHLNMVLSINRPQDHRSREKRSCPSFRNCTKSFIVFDTYQSGVR